MSGSQLTGKQLIRIDLGTLQWSVFVPDNFGNFWPAADSDSNRVAYTDYVVGSNNCYLLTIVDGTTGIPVNYGQPRYGAGSTWYRGKVLTNGRKPPTGAGKCVGLDAITEVDPLTSAEKILARGYDPDAR